MTKAVKEIGLRLVEKQSNDQAVKILDELTDMAKKGELVEFTSMYRKRGDSDAYYWAGTRVESLDDMIKHLAVMQYKMCKRMMND